MVKEAEGSASQVVGGRIQDAQFQRRVARFLGRIKHQVGGRPIVSQIAGHYVRLVKREWEEESWRESRSKRFTPSEWESIIGVS